MLKKSALMAAAALVLAGCAGYGTAPNAAAGAGPVAGTPVAGSAATEPVSVILFVSDGASYETWNMAGYWARGTADGAPWSGFPVKLGMTTFPLNGSNTPTNDAVAKIGYDPATAWDAAPVVPDTQVQRPAIPGGPATAYPAPFAGYQWIKRDYTDSAAAGTALATGVKSFNNAISVDNFGKALPRVTELAKAAGRATGVVSSVPFSHATPAVFGASNVRRNNYHEIARDMLRNPALDVIIGAGHPEYDDNGAPRATPLHQFISPEDWAALKSSGQFGKFTDAMPEIQALADGRAATSGRLVVIPRVASTLQYGRRSEVTGPDVANPSGAAFLRDIPNLPTLTRAALNRLGQNPGGMFLMVEGGAVDWAAHANATGRIIEEQLDFEAAVAATMDWLRAKGRLDSTLVIVLTDHGNALPLGPDSDRTAWQPVVNMGKGKLPQVKWHSGTHTNENTRLWASGPGAACLNQFVVGTDPGLRDIVRHNGDGRYIDNVAIKPVIAAALAGKGCPAR